MSYSLQLTVQVSILEHFPSLCAEPQAKWNPDSSGACAVSRRTVGYVRGLTRHTKTIIALAMMIGVSVTRAEVSSVQDQQGAAMVNGQAAVPEGLAGSDWNSIRQVYEQNRHAAVAVDGEFRARNPSQQWLTHFDGRGFVVKPDGAGWQWGLELQSYGFSGHQRSINGQASMTADNDIVTYDWHDGLREWFVNDRSGLEHGFTLTSRPPGAGDPRANARKNTIKQGQACLPVIPAQAGIQFRNRSTPENPRRIVVSSCADPADDPQLGENDRLELRLAVRGGLRAQGQADGLGVSFVNQQGSAVVNYAGLKVWDADHRELPARIDADATGLRLTVDERNARYPLTIDPIAQQAYLKASNTDVNDEFGGSVSVSGDTVVVGARGEASNATGVNGNQADNSISFSGAAYVFIRNSGGVWSQQAYLKASNTDRFDEFGASVSVSGDTVVVGAFREASHATSVNGNQADNSASSAGAAYVFVRDSGGVWSQQAYLKASNTDAGDSFGRGVSVSGDTVVVGAYIEDSGDTGVNGNQADNSANGSGAAYVFFRNPGGVWSQQAYLKASNTDGGIQFGDRFGATVAVSGDTVVVGATSEDSNATGVNGNQADNSALGSGAAYVFVRDSGSVWSQQAYLKASNTGVADSFGSRIAVSGDTVVVGTPEEDSNATGVNGNQADNSAINAGAAYVFVRNSSGVWRQQAYLKGSNTEKHDVFGSSVSVSGDTVVVGAYGEGSNATGVNGNQADNSGSDTGAVYVFVRDGVGVWSQKAYLKASNTGFRDQFGISVAVSDATVVVGARFEGSNATGVDGNQADNSVANSGAAYVFTLSVCGDGLIEGAEQCDDGLDNSDTVPDACRTDCSAASCGDGVVDSGESCDDGNNQPNDGCDENCAVELGACCQGTGCNIVTEFDCSDAGGAFFGFNTTCNSPDADGDGLRDECDMCPNDPNKIQPGICGCNRDDFADSDGDGVPDCDDQCLGVDDSIFAPDCVGAIPTVSEWGLVVLALLLLISGKLYFGKRIVWPG